jgi:hypothetical protein
MTPEEAHALRKRIEELTSVGKRLLKRERRNGAESHKKDEEYRFSAWLGAVSSLIKTEFKDNPALIRRSDLLLPAPEQTSPEQASPESGTPKTASEAVSSWVDLVSLGVDLLETAKDYILVDAISTASDSLKRLIEATITEGYFKSWPFRLLVIAFGVVTTVYLGGTLYLNWQVQSIGNQAAEARKTIESAKQDVFKNITDTIASTQQEAKKEANDELDVLKAQIKSSNSDMEKLIQEVTAKATSGEKSIENAVESEKNQVPDRVYAIMQPKIDKTISDDVYRRVAQAQTTISGEIETVATRRKDVIEELERASAKLPEETEFANSEASKFNKYVARHGDILNKLIGSGPLSGLQGIAHVLGAWCVLLIGSPLIAVIAAYLAWHRAKFIKQQIGGGSGARSQSTPRVLYALFIAAGVAILAYSMSLTYVAGLEWVTKWPIHSYLLPVDYVEITTSQIIGAVLLVMSILSTGVLYIVLAKRAIVQKLWRATLVGIVCIIIPLIVGFALGYFDSARLLKQGPLSLMTLHSRGIEKSESAAQYKGSLVFVLSRQVLFRPEADSLAFVPKERIALVETFFPPSGGSQPSPTPSPSKESNAAALPNYLLPTIPEKLERPLPIWTLIPSPTPTPVPIPRPEASSGGSEASPTPSPSKESKAAALPNYLLPTVPQKLERPPRILTLIPSPTPTPIPGPTSEPTRSRKGKHKAHN